MAGRYVSVPISLDMYRHLNKVKTSLMEKAGKRRRSLLFIVDTLIQLLVSKEAISIEDEKITIDLSKLEEQLKQDVLDIFEAARDVE